MASILGVNVPDFGALGQSAKRADYSHVGEFLKARNLHPARAYRELTAANLKAGAEVALENKDPRVQERAKYALEALGRGMLPGFAAMKGFEQSIETGEWAKAPAGKGWAAPVNDAPAGCGPRR